MMGKRAVAFRQADVKRAVRAAEAAGLKVFGVVFDPSGQFTLITDAAARKDVELPALDQWMARHAHPA